MYSRPTMSVVELDTAQMMAQSIVSKDLGITYGGKTSDHTDITGADVNDNKGWDLW